MMNLGVAYCDRIRGDRSENIEMTIDAYQQALEVRTREAMPVEWAEVMVNLGVAYRNRTRGERADNLDAAIDAYRQALEVRTREAMPVAHRSTQRNLANLCFAEGHWAEAVIALQGVLAANNLLYLSAATPEARRAELHEVHGLPARLSYALAQTATDDDSAPLQEAVLALERNRARWLSEALALRSERPESVPDEAWQRFAECTQQVQILQAEARLPEGIPGKHEYVVLSQDLVAAYAALEEAVDEVRRHASDFMPVPTFADVQAAARVSPLIYIAATSAGGLALSVRADKIIPVWLDALTDEALNKRLRGLTEDEWREIFAQWKKGDATQQDIDKISSGYLGAYFSWRNDSHNEDARRTWLTALEETIAWLRATIMEPLQELLADAAQVTLIPTGDLALLPLHAASSLPGEGRGPVFTYAPNARALAAARETAAQMTPPYSLLAVDNPDGSLHYASDEIAATFTTFPDTQRTRLTGNAATEQAVTAALPQHTVWQFFTHGQAGWDTPLEGSLLLTNGARLTLRDILQLNVASRLALLWACESGIPGPDLPDEVVGLPTGLLQAGVAGIVGSLWSVDGYSTALLMLRFYEAWRAKGQTPPLALHTAQTWLRESTNADFEAYFKAQLPQFGGAGELPHNVATTAYRHFWRARDRQARPFAAAFYWAGFYYTGV
jgi:CHAT domain-containing protein